MKQAALKTELQPHQQNALKRGLENNLILAHATGSGKTLTSLAIADAIGKPTVCFTPASLVNNYKKEIQKHIVNGPRFDVYSMPTAVSRDIPIPKGSTVIIDEAHALRNKGTSRYNYMTRQLPNAGRIIALTGTPAYNKIEDWAPLVNLVSQQKMLPEDPKKFQDLYVQAREKDPGAFNRYVLGIKPGVTYHLKNQQNLKNRLAKYVDVFDKEVEKPRVEYQDINVPMTDEQTKVYNFIEGDLPFWLRLKMSYNLPPSKQEASSLNSFLTGVRQVANTPETFQQNDKTPGSKILQSAATLQEMYKKNPKFRALVYSNFREAGVDSLAKELDKAKIPYAIFHGGLSQKQKADIVNRYNAGKLPVILGTGSASEGLDLKETNLIQLLEPHFNNSRLDQVIGRGVRYKSHDALPPEERKVLVQRFYSQYPTGRKTTVDGYLKARAAEKEQLINEVKGLFK